MPTAVPTTAVVRPGTAVNIVLKADQPTGRTVAGTIRDVLTKGNHPRGIKVRLADGRIGRVQSLASGSSIESGGDRTEEKAAAAAAAELGAIDADPGEHGGRGSRGGGFQGGGGRRGGKYSDIRLDDDLEAPSEQIGLDAYIKPAKAKRGRGKKHTIAANEAGPSTGASTVASETEQGTAACPVCGEFEGDEAAVAHHVAGHFD